MGWQKKCRLSHNLGCGLPPQYKPIPILRVRLACAMGRHLVSAAPGTAKKSPSPGRASLLCSRHRLALVFRQHRASGRGKIPPQLLITRGGHGRHPTPTPAFVLSNYNLSGKLLKTGTEARSALINSPSTLLKLKRRNINVEDFLRTAFRRTVTTRRLFLFC